MTAGGAMELSSRPLSLSIVDFLGIAIPGVVWAVLIATVGTSVLNYRVDLSPVGTVLTALDHAPKYLWALLFLSVVIGYAITPIVMRVSEFVLLAVEYC